MRGNWNCTCFRVPRLPNRRLSVKIKYFARLKSKPKWFANGLPSKKCKNLDSRVFSVLTKELQVSKKMAATSKSPQ